MNAENSTSKGSKLGAQQTKINDYMDKGDKNSKNPKSNKLNKRDSKHQQKVQDEQMAINDWQKTAVVSCHFTLDCSLQTVSA